MNFPVAELKQRYQIGKQADINRRKHLGIVPQKLGKTYVIDDEQLSLLDRLDEFLKSSPKAKMTDFDDSSGHTILDATVVDSSGSSDLVIQEEDEHTDLVHLVETIAHSISPLNPIAHWEKLQWLVDNEIIISTSEAKALMGRAPEGDTFIRGSFKFTKSGKIGLENGWAIAKLD